MRAELRSIGSPDVDIDLFEPALGAPFSIFVEVTVGPVGRNGEESFNVVVASLSWLASKLREEDPIVLRHHIFVESWDSAALRIFLKDLVGQQTGSDWRELALRLSRFAYWEFEDYSGLD